MRIGLMVFRKEKGLTQIEMAKKLGITNNHYSRLERGENNPSMQLIEKMNEVFHIKDAYKLFEKC